MQRKALEAPLGQLMPLHLHQEGGWLFTPGILLQKRDYIRSKEVYRDVQNGNEA